MSSSIGKLWYLKKIDVFAEMSSEEVEELSKLTRMQDVPKGQPLYFPGETSDTVFMLKQGRVRISRMDREGNEITLAILEPGEIFGEMALTGEEERQSRAETLEKSFICLISRDRFLRFLEDHPELNFRITRLMGERRRKIEEKIDQLLFRDAPSRMAFVLADLFENHAEPRENTEPPRIHFSHQDLADLAGLTRPTATTLLNQLKQEDIIEIGRREITLRDPGKLRQKIHSDE